MVRATSIAMARANQLIAFRYGRLNAGKTGVKSCADACTHSKFVFLLAFPDQTPPLSRPIRPVGRSGGHARFEQHT